MFYFPVYTEIGVRMECGAPFLERASSLRFFSSFAAHIPDPAAVVRRKSMLNPGISCEAR